MIKNMFKAEWIKYKRSFAKKLALLAPFIFVIYGVIVTFYLPDQTKLAWDSLLAMIFNWWPVLFIPVGITLFCTLAELREKKAGNYRSIRSNNINLIKFWFCKIMVIGYYLLLSSIVLIIATMITGSWTTMGNAPLFKIIEASLLVWLVSLSLIPIHLFVVHRFGYFVSLGLGIGTMLIGVLGAQESYWIFIPWSWPTRLMSPIVSVHPNGVMLHMGDPLLDPSVIPMGVTVSLVFFIASSILTAYLFKRRELR